MKKLLSLITAAMLAFPAAVPAKTAAEEDSSLRQLVTVLGGDTDYIDLQNFGYDLPVITGTTRYRNLVPLLPQESSESWEESLPWYCEISLGASVLTIKNHNGSDPYTFGQDVSCLKDAVIDKFAVANILSYQEIMDDNRFRLAVGYRFHSMTMQEKIADLLETAQDCGDLGKYFLIMYGRYSTEPESAEEDESGINRPLHTHCAVGIGAAKGSWVFGGRSFDRCILTLDNENIAEKGQAFDERTCIYVNSETLDSYVPLYSDAAPGDLHIVGLDMDKYKEESEGITDLRLFNKDYYQDYSVIRTEDDGYAYSLDDHNEFGDYFHTPLNNEIFMDTTDFTLLRRGTIPGHGFSDIEFDSYCRSGRFTISGRDCDILFSKDGYSLRVQPLTESSVIRSDYVSYQLHVNDEVGVPTMCRWLFSGKAYDTASYKLDGKSVLYDPGRTDEGSAIWLTCDDGSNGHIYKLNLFTTRPVNIVLDSQFGADLYIDPDGDGDFDRHIESGDVNCDGFTDAVDASLVLLEYAAALTGSDSRLNYDIADVNGDDTVDAADASDILAAYSENMTS